MMTTRTRKKPIPKKKKAKKFNKKRFFAWTLMTAAFAVFCAMAGYLFIIINGERLLRQNWDKMQMPETSIIYDAQGKEITKLYRQNREYVTLSEMPQRLAEAFIATEDRRFSEHAGIDIWAIGRALYKDIVHRGAVEGGSTITQQLAKNIFFTSWDKTLFRKATEASIALALERNYTKDEILEKYLNQIYFGNGVYGVKAAAELYFGKSDLDGKNGLTLGEMATLAGIPKSPANFNPLDSPENAKDRRAVVLKLMYEQGYITKEEMDAANAEEFHVPVNRDKKRYLAFVDYVQKEAAEAAGISEEELNLGGYHIYTTMDAKAQQTLEAAFENDNYFQKDGPKQKMQGSMVIVDHKNGGIVAMVGGRDYVRKGLNRALVPRQPGSSFKPIVSYAPALETGNWNPYSLLKDERMSFGNYTPRNYDNRYRGQVTMIYAVQQSINVPAVWLLNEIGIKKGVEFAADLGIPLEPEDKNQLGIALGGLKKGVSPLQMAQAYGAFANGGVMNKAHAIERIVDRDGRQVYQFKPEQKKVMSPKTAYYMTLMLQSVVENGTGKRARINRPVAGKTGTTELGIDGINNSSANRDVWFVGYTPEWTAAVWMGFDKTDARHYVTIGSGAPAKLFADVMSKALAGKPVVRFAKPEGVPELARPPKAVTDLTAVYVPEEQGVKLQWTPQKGDIEYRVYRKEAAEEKYTQLVTSTTAEVKDISVEPGKTYRYYVIPYRIDAKLEGDRSNIAEVTIPSDMLPPDMNLPDGTDPNSPDEPLPGDTGELAPPDGTGEQQPPGDGTTDLPQDNPNTPGDGTETVPGTGGAGQGEGGSGTQDRTGQVQPQTPDIQNNARRNGFREDRDRGSGIINFGDILNGTR